MSAGLQKCYDAFDRLKAGKGTHEDCLGLALNEITFAKISLEAGFTSGYLRPKRENHALLFSMLNDFLGELPKNLTTGKGVLLQREKSKVKTARDDAALTEAKLQASLGRELQLYHALKNAEEEVAQLKFELAKFSNVTQFPI